MNEIYIFKEKLKNDILEQLTSVDFPEKILRTHSAKLSEFKDSNQNYEAFSHLFVEKG